jgi:peptidyl-prolyl cis-trans isomerase B (cyclophilin B)
MLNDIRIVIHTAKGDIDVTLFPEKAPLAAANFLNLALRKFYDNLSFHRVVPKFVIQGGDPEGNGRGGPGYKFKNEIHASLSHATVGMMAMANAGPNTNGSQFYITLEALPDGHVQMLDGSYSIFGQVTKGVDVANQISQGDKIDSVEVLDPVDALFTAENKQLAEWNQVLDRKFSGRLAPATNS